jgi:hypothetical protein
MPAPLPAVASTTILNYLKGQNDNTLRRYKLLALLQQRGMVEYNASGTGFQWVLKYLQSPMRQYASGVTPTFGDLNKHQDPVLDWRGYYLTMAMHEVDVLMNKGEQALVNRLAIQSSDLLTDMEQQFHSQLFVDGNATGNENCIHGTESFFSVSAAATAGYVGTPNDSYAGLSTALGAVSGTWSNDATTSTTNWPRGFGDPDYDYFSPLVVDYTNASFGSGGWAANCEKAISFAIAHTRRNAGSQGMADVVMLEPELWRQFTDFNRSRQRINVTPGGKTGLVSLGFNDVINFDGVEVTPEFGIGAGIGYGLNIADIELKSLRSQLFEPAGPEWVLQYAAYLTFLRFNGNMKFNPRSQFKFKNIT